MDEGAARLGRLPEPSTRKGRRLLRPSLDQRSNKPLSEDGNMKKVAQGVPKPKLFVFSGLARHVGSPPHVIFSLCNPRIASP